LGGVGVVGIYSTFLSELSALLADL